MKKTKITALALAAAIALPVVSNSFADDADLYEEEVFVIEGEKYLDDDGFDYDDDDDRSTMTMTMTTMIVMMTMMIM